MENNEGLEHRRDPILGLGRTEWLHRCLGTDDELALGNDIDDHPRIRTQCLGQRLAPAVQLFG